MKKLMFLMALLLSGIRKSNKCKKRHLSVSAHGIRPTEEHRFAAVKLGYMKTETWLVVLGVLGL